MNQSDAALSGFFESRGPDFVRRRQAARSLNPYLLQEAAAPDRAFDTFVRKAVQKPLPAPRSPEAMSNGMFRALMEYSAATQPELKTFVVAARLRHEQDPEGSVRLDDLKTYAKKAGSHGLKQAAATFENLHGLARTGELRRIMAGEKTLNVRQAMWTKLRRYGKTEFGRGDFVIHKPTGKRGTVVDYVPDSKEFVIQIGEFDVATCKAGDLMKSTALEAKARIDRQAANKEKIAKIAAIGSEKPRANDFVRRTAQSGFQLQNAVMQAAEQALMEANFPLPPTLRFVGFSNVRHAADNSVIRAEGRVQVRAPTNLGPRIEIMVHVPVLNGAVRAPSHFSLGGRAFPFTQGGLHRALQGFELAPRPRHYRPYDIPAMIKHQDTNVRGMWAPPRYMPRDAPGRGITPQLY